MTKGKVNQNCIFNDPWGRFLFVLGYVHKSLTVKMQSFFASSCLLWDMEQTNYRVLMCKEGSTKIVIFFYPEAEVIGIGRWRGRGEEVTRGRLKIVLFWWRVLIYSTLLVILVRGYSAINLFYDGSADIQIWAVLTRSVEFLIFKWSLMPMVLSLDYVFQFDIYLAFNKAIVHWPLRDNSSNLIFFTYSFCYHVTIYSKGHKHNSLWTHDSNF